MIHRQRPSFKFDEGGLLSLALEGVSRKVCRDSRAVRNQAVGHRLCLDVGEMDRRHQIRTLRCFALRQHFAWILQHIKEIEIRFVTLEEMDKKASKTFVRRFSNISVFKVLDIAAARITVPSTWASACATTIEKQSRDKASCVKYLHRGITSLRKVLMSCGRQTGYELRYRGNGGSMLKQRLVLLTLPT